MPIAARPTEELMPTSSRARSNAGFTLIELLIVIVVLGVLAAAVVFAVSASKDRGATAACQTDVKSVTTAAEAYNAEHGAYAPSIDALVRDGFLHSAPSSTSYSVKYSVTGPANGSQTVNVWSSTCAPNYCAELGLTASQIQGVDLQNSNQAQFQQVVTQLAALVLAAPNDRMKTDYTTLLSTFNQRQRILAAAGLTFDDLQSLNSGGLPKGITQQQAQQVSYDLGQTFATSQFQSAYGEVINGATSDCGVRLY
jgi:prepilin-type N-terminal cleavage/methylation domain-containing protein